LILGGIQQDKDTKSFKMSSSVFLIDQDGGFNESTKLYDENEIEAPDFFYDNQ